MAVTNGVDSLWVTLILCPVQCISRDLLNMPKIRLAAMLFATIAILEVVRTDQPGCDLVLPADGSVFFVLVFSFVTIDTVTRAAQTSSAFHPLCIVERLLERWQSLACFLKFHRSQVRVSQPQIHFEVYDTTPFYFSLTMISLPGELARC